MALGSEVPLTAWGQAEAGDGLTYDWSALAGRLSGEGARAFWNLAGLGPGTYRAMVVARDGRGRFATCSMEVWVGDELRSGGRETRRAFLERDRLEETGFSLYSYLLFGKRPTQATRDRYVAALDAFLNMLEVARLEKDLSLEELNVTYLPVAVDPGDDIIEEADWLLERYDYDRAAWLLKRAGVTGAQAGPYLVSRLGKPLSDPGDGEGRILQDLTGFPPRVVEFWIELFIGQAAQQRYWEKLTARELVLRVRTALAVAEESVATLARSLSDLVAWKDGP